MNIEHVLEPLAGIDYPAERDDVLMLARRGGAPAPVLEVLQGLPAQSFNGRYEIRQALNSTKEPAGLGRGHGVAFSG